MLYFTSTTPSNLGFSMGYIGLKNELPRSKLRGSSFFTKTAEEKNAENLLVIKDAPELVKAYEQNIRAHAAHSHPYTQAAATASPAASPLANADGEVHGNRNSKV